MNEIGQPATHSRLPRRWLLPLIQLFLTAFVNLQVSASCVSAQETKLTDYMDLNALTTADNNWQVVRQDIRDDGGHVKLRNSKWLMYFLHWRPLEDPETTVTSEYARKHMLNFWGESMPFELSGIEREMLICGHQAVITEGTIYDGRISTRFIVWNCPETGRQFTADCNINLARGTPMQLLEVQEDITETIRCHLPFVAPVNDDLTTPYVSSKWKVAFSTPGNWHTEDFLSEEWFPEEMTFDNGSLWTLLDDSDKRIELRWELTDSAISGSMLRRFLEQLPQDTAVLHDTALAMKIRLDTVRDAGDYCFGGGTYQYDRNLEGKNYSFSYRYCSLLWKIDDHAYVLIASIAAIDKFWGMPVDLVPSDERMDKYLWREVVPHVNVFNINRKP